MRREAPSFLLFDPKSFGGVYLRTYYNQSIFLCSCALVLLTICKFSLRQKFGINGTPLLNNYLRNNVIQTFRLIELSISMCDVFIQQIMFISIDWYAMFHRIIFRFRWKRTTKWCVLIQLTCKNPIFLWKQVKFIQKDELHGINTNMANFEITE